MEPAVDLDQDEFGDRLAQIERLVADTNRQVHAMRRAQRTRWLVGLLWKAAIFAAVAFAYYFYVQPHVEQLMSAYGSARGFEDQVSGFFGQYFGTTTRP